MKKKSYYAKLLEFYQYTRTGKSIGLFTLDFSGVSNLVKKYKMYKMFGDQL
jgi:hypothetical protein